MLNAGTYFIKDASTSGYNAKVNVPIVKAIRSGHSIFKQETDCQPKIDLCIKMKIRKIMKKMQMSKYRLRFFNK